MHNPIKESVYSAHKTKMAEVTYVKNRLQKKRTIESTGKNNQAADNDTKSTNHNYSMDTTMEGAGNAL